MTLSRVRMKCSDFRKGEFIMKKIITLILVGCMALSIGGCATEDAADSLNDTINTLNTSDSKEVMEIKNGYLPISDQVTVGEALDSFLLNPKWQYFVSTDNYQVVQCTGECLYNDKSVEAKIQFLSYDDGTFELHTVALNDIEQDESLIIEFFVKAYEDAGATDLYDDGGEDELKGSSTATSHTNNNNSTSTPQNTQVSTQTNTQTNNNNSVSTPPPYGDIGDVGVISTDGYDLDQYYITDTLLDRLSQDEVRTLLNAMYAHYGYTFTTEQYAQFFSSKPWYSSRGTSMSDCESMFNDYERKNKETITDYESRKGWR